MPVVNTGPATQRVSLVQAGAELESLRVHCTIQKCVLENLGILSAISHLCPGL